MQLAIGTKKRFHHRVRSCEFYLNGMSTLAHLNVLPLEPYNMLLGMDWLYIHRTKVDCYDKAIECLYDDGERRILQGKNKHASVRMVIVMQATCSSKKGCVMFEIHISSEEEGQCNEMQCL